MLIRSSWQFIPLIQLILCSLLMLHCSNLSHLPTQVNYQSLWKTAKDSLQCVTGTSLASSPTLLTSLLTKPHLPASLPTLLTSLLTNLLYQPPYQPLQQPLPRSEEHTSELQSLRHLVCRLLLEKKKTHSHL